MKLLFLCYHMEKKQKKDLKYWTKTEDVHKYLSLSISLTCIASVVSLWCTNTEAFVAISQNWTKKNSSHCKLCAVPIKISSMWWSHRVVYRRCLLWLVYQPQDEREFGDWGNCLGVGEERHTNTQYWCSFSVQSSRERCGQVRIESNIESKRWGRWKGLNTFLG